MHKFPIRETQNCTSLQSLNKSFWKLETHFEILTVNIRVVDRKIVDPTPHSDGGNDRMAQLSQEQNGFMKAYTLLKGIPSRLFVTVRSGKDIVAKLTSEVYIEIERVQSTFGTMGSAK